MAYEPTPTIQGIPADDGNLLASVVRALPQKVVRISFTKAVSNNVDSEWGALVGSIGTGMGVNQTGGNLVITSGTTARSETIIRSTAAFEGGIRMRVRSTLSQRIANNNFFAELVDVIGDGLTYSIGSATAITVTIPSNPFDSSNIGQSMYIGVFSGTGTFLTGRYPIASVSGNDVTFTVSGFAVGTGTCSLFGWNYYQLLYTGTTATQASFDAQRKGYASGATTATINTTASPGHLAIITGNDLSAAFADQLIASTAGTIQQSVRSTRVENVPDDASLRMQIRVANGSTAPATTTTWTIGFVSVSNYANQDVTIQDVRPMNVGSGLPVEILRSSINAVTQSGTWNIGTVTPGTAATNLGKARNSAVGATDTQVGMATLRNDTLTSFGTSGNYNTPITDRYGSLVTKDQLRHKRTYSAAFIVTVAAGAVTDVFQLIGSASTSVQITNITISGTQTTAGQIPIVIVKRSTANAGGTSTSATILPLEATDAAATAVGTIYTANPTTGTPVGNVKFVYVPIGSATVGCNPVEFNFADKGKPFILTGVSQALAISMNGSNSPTGLSLAISIEFTEE